MGGNRKQANRTKNNARPANSGRSAELLGSKPPPFVGFSAVKDGAFVTVLPGFSSNVDDINPDVDPNFQILLKKMNKKDSTTKLKALQEFSELIKGSEVEAVKAILPFWPRLYCQLATDAEHRVREALHQAQRVVVSKAKRNIAPFLKQLAGPWFTSQYDTYAPAATAAQQAFQEAFPPNKLLEAINFCQEEILAYIIDNLTVQTAQTLSNPKTTAPEDVEAKHQRVLISCLQGYVLYLRKLPTEHLETARESNRRLIGDARYWKLAKHAAPMVRSAWFSAVIALCQKSPDLVASEASRVVTATLGRLDESDPAVLPIVWEAALHVMTTVPDCWSHVNADKVVLPKLYGLAREGGQGSAGSIFPNLLPFLSKLPESVRSDKQAFYDRFFASMRTGFTQKCVVQSPSESSAVARCYVECLKYAIMTNRKDPDFCEHVITNQLIPAMSLALTDQRLNLFYATHFAQVSLLVHQWDRDRVTDPNARLLGAFWSATERLVADVLPAGDSPWTPERQVALCLSLQGVAPRRAPNLRVKFDREEGSETETSSSPGAGEHGEAFSASLRSLVRSVCVLYVRSSDAVELLGHLSRLVEAFDSRELFASLAGCPYALFEGPLRGWLESEGSGVRPAVDISLVLLKHLEPAERSQVMDALGKLCAGPSACDCLAAALRHRDQPDVTGFLRGDHTNRLLAGLATEMCLGTAETRAWELLRQCCTSKTAGGDWILPDGTFCDLASLFEDHDSPDAVALVADILFGRRLNEATMETAERYLVHLLRLSATPGGGGGALGAAVRGAARAMEGRDVTKQLSTLVLLEIENSRRMAATKPGYEYDLDLLVSAIYRFLVAGSEDSPPVWPVRQYLGRCSLHLAALEPALRYVSQDYHERWRQHSILKMLGTCECRTLRTPYDPSLEASLDLHLTSLWFHLLLTEKLTVREQPDNEDDEEDAEEAAEQDGEDLSAMNAVFRPMRDHIQMLSDSIQMCSDFAARYPSTVYNYKITTRLATLAPICDRLRKWMSLRIDAHVLKPRESIRQVELRFPWNRIVTKPEVSDESTSEETVEAEKPAVDRFTSTSMIDIQECWWTDISTDVEDPLEALDILAALDRTRLLFETDVSSESESRVASVATVARLLSDLIGDHADELRPNHWDFCVIALASWVQSVARSRHGLLVRSPLFPVRPVPTDPDAEVEYDPTWDDPAGLQVQRTHHHNAAMLTSAVSELFVTFRRHLSATPPQDPDKAAAHDKMRQEWADLFERDTEDVLVDVFIMVAESSRETDLSLLDLPAIEGVALALQSFDVAKCSRRDELLDCCLRTTCSPVLVLQLAAFHVLHDLSLSLAVKDSETLLTSEDQPDPTPTQLTIRRLLPQLAYTRTVVTAMLADVRPGESCLVAPYTDAATYTLAHLSVWTVVLSMCRHADSVLRSQYAAVVREENNLDHLLRAVFRLMPEDVLAISHGKNRSRRTRDLFSIPPRLEQDQMVTGAVVEHLACWVYWLCLCRLPAEVRMWWTSVDQRYCSLVDRVTTNHVSPVLCDLEMKTVQTHVAKRKSNISIKVHASVNEVHAVYTVDEARLELSMSLPANYPLGLVVIDTKNTEKIQESGKEGRGWLMQLRMFLSHQNGSLWEGLSLWKSNLDKRFEGVEECYICYSILHGSNFQLPKVACRTCKKKFHSGCMYKWFNTSNKPTCPICRNQF